MDFTPLLQALVGLVVTVITCYLIPLIKSRTTEKQREDAYGWVKIAVAALEQAYRNNPKMGVEKKKAVIEFLRAKGIILDEAALDKMIEAAVYQLTNLGISADVTALVEAAELLETGDHEGAK